MMWLHDKLHELCETPEFLPLEAGRSKHLELSIKIDKPLQINCEDDLFNQLIRILSSSLNQIYKEYAEDFYFHEPNLIYKPRSDLDCGYLIIEVWMMDKKIWDKKNV